MARISSPDDGCFTFAANPEDAISVTAMPITLASAVCERCIVPYIVM